MRWNSYRGSPHSPPRPWGWCGSWARTPAVPGAAVHQGSLKGGGATQLRSCADIGKTQWPKSIRSYTLGRIHQSWKTLHPLQTPRQQSSRSHPTWWWASLGKENGYKGEQVGLVSSCCTSVNKNLTMASTHPSFKINREPVWHVDHLEPLLNFFVKLHFAQVFTFTGLRAKHSHTYSEDRGQKGFLLAEQSITFNIVTITSIYML